MKKRDINLDLIRCVAIFCLLSAHFFLNSGFYSVIVIGWKMYIMTTIRTMSMMCVPLFLLLTGYLMCKKELSAKYYKGIIRILMIHGICTILHFLYRHFFQNMPIDFKTVFLGMFANTGYSWYIGLYIGLFCLIPFLNLIYNGLDARWKKRTLILTLVGLTAMPSFGNYFVRTMPDSFLGMYPITYYFIGAYIREYNKDWNKWACFSIFCIVTLINSFVNIIISYNKGFVWTALADWGGIENTLSATLLFVFLKKINLERCPKAAAVCMMKISEWSLGMYLLSWIFDQYAYPKLTTAVSVIDERWKFYIVMVGFVFVCSAILSGIVDIIYRLLVKLAYKFWNTIIEKKNNQIKSV